MTKIRWGVLSTARIGRNSVNPAIQSASNAELIAVASRDGQRAEDFADDCNIARPYGSYEELLDDPDIDAVYVPLPNSLHAEWTIRAVKRGKHVLCEKPIAVNATECEAMFRAASEHGVHLMEAFMYRYHPRTMGAIDLVRRGAIGEIRTIRSAFTFKLLRPNDVRFDAELGGGALFDVGCYCVSATRTMMGYEPTAVQAWARWTRTGVDVALTGLLHFREDLIAHFDCALDMERREFYDVAGTDASIVAEAAYAPGKGDVSIVEHRVNREQVRHDFAGIDQYRLMIEDFSAAILEKRPPRYGFEDALANMRTIDALYRSARRNGALVEV